MKTIIYFFIISLFAITLSAPAQNTPGKNKNLILQASNKNVTTQVLYQSGNIISQRLKTYGLTSFDVNVMAGKGQIKVQIPDNLESKEIEGLLLSKGELAFYETLTPDGITDYLKSDPRFSPRDEKIGCAATENHEMVAKVQEYLKLKNLSSGCKLMWGKVNSKSQTCLYVLKTNESGRPLLDRSDVETIKSATDNNSQSILIDIKFNVLSGKIWEKATRDNLNKPIAIVIDDKVFYDPVVKVAIVNGLCEISGDMTQKEVNYFLALVNNAPLTLNFSLIK